jgi:N-6 DNA Methylase
MKFNERYWAGQLIGWIQQVINDGRTIFQDAGNDAGIKLESGRTKFPDVLLFTDKASGIIFNGWELKFPDTAVDDLEMLENALEKAEKIKSNSFVTWNGAEAIIWKIKNETYTTDNLEAIKHYSKESNINKRNDLAEPANYRQNEPLLRERLEEILHDLEQLYRDGELKQAIRASDNFIEAVKIASQIILPQFKNEINRLKGESPAFRAEFNRWKIYESSTLKILANSSRRPENVIDEEVLAKFTFYNLIGKIVLYLTLADNLSGHLEKLEIENEASVKEELQTYFESASTIDYQAVFQPYFTDQLNYNETVNAGLLSLFETISLFDFKNLSSDVIAEILENLVPKEEKQKFGQYFTPETLANLVTFPVIQTRNDVVFDPTSGTGTFLNSFYQILNFYGNHNHSQLLNQIWGNDVSHFPAILSVINLYKQKVGQTDNFPRVTRDDFFNLESGAIVTFPDSANYENKIEQEIPVFDAIASNFPFVQQEDIPNDVLTEYFRERFEKQQQAFLRNNTFSINERSDYFTYCIYNSIRFLKEDGFLSAITSNAWLGKEYGFQFKKFLLDNFHIKYIVRSNAEHWFKESQVTTIYSVLQRGQSNEPTKFVTVNFKLEELFNQENISTQLGQIEGFYADIDNCDDPRNTRWKRDTTFPNLYHRTNDLSSVSIVTNEQLINSLETQENWDTFFISATLFEQFDDYLIQLYPEIINSFRGERTGWNEMFVIPADEVSNTGIEERFLIPYVKSPTELETLEFDGNYNYFLFVCNLPETDLRRDFSGAYRWIRRFENATNQNGSKTIQEACTGHRPFWYSLRPKQANIVTAINPYERFFFSFSEEPFTIDQRLIAMTVNEGQNVELLAALFNSIITFLSMEMRGTSRNLGALDLNANYFKTLRVLNPNLLSEESKQDILNAFQPLKEREIQPIIEEIRRDDRINFDRVVLNSFGIDETILLALYQILSFAVSDRVNMSER